MQDLTANLPISTVPTVEQINLEYQRFQEATDEAIKHAIACGLITPVHAEIFKNDPMTLLATILVDGA